MKEELKVIGITTVGIAGMVGFTAQEKFIPSVADYHQIIGYTDLLSSGQFSIKLAFLVLVPFLVVNWFRGKRLERALLDGLSRSEVLLVIQRWQIALALLLTFAGFTIQVFSGYLNKCPIWEISDSSFWYATSIHTLTKFIAYYIALHYCFTLGIVFQRKWIIPIYIVAQLLLIPVGYLGLLQEHSRYYLAPLTIAMSLGMTIITVPKMIILFFGVTTLHFMLQWFFLTRKSIR